MSIRYEVKGLVADGDFDTEIMYASFGECELSSIQFFDEEGEQIVPTAGSVTFTGSPDGYNWRDIQDGSFLAADAYSPTRTPPYAEGLMLKARIKLTGVTGAETFAATVWRK